MVDRLSASVATVLASAPDYPTDSGPTSVRRPDSRARLALSRPMDQFGGRAPGRLNALSKEHCPRYLVDQSALGGRCNGHARAHTSAPGAIPFAQRRHGARMRSQEARARGAVPGSLIERLGVASPYPVSQAAAVCWHAPSASHRDGQVGPRGGLALDDNARPILVSIR